jgi:hypothetical protein
MKRFRVSGSTSISTAVASFSTRAKPRAAKWRSLPFSALPELAAVLKRQREYTDDVQRRTGQIIPWGSTARGQRVVSIRQRGVPHVRKRDSREDRA